MSRPLIGETNSNVKAHILVRKQGRDIANIPCHFNPTEYTISRSVDWDIKTANGSDVPNATFKGGGKSSLSLSLLFDTLADGDSKDVREFTKPLWQAALIHEDEKNPVTGTGEPAQVVFMWGTTWSFQAVVTSIKQSYTLFKSDGTPVRSTVSLELTQVVDSKKHPKQNPTSTGISGKIHVVRDGDRLDLIAATYYQKPTMWRPIAERNGIDNPRELWPGQRLVIPNL